MVYVLLWICPRKRDVQNSLKFLETDYLISARRLNLVIVNYKSEPAKYLTLPFKLTTENEKRNKYLDLAKELKKKTKEHESDSDT